jgi:transcriptional regulator with XRE-family HTH domain
MGAFSAWLQDELRRQGKSQVWLAEAVGVSESTVSRWLNDDTEPKARTLRRIASALGTDMYQAAKLLNLPLPEPSAVTDEGARLQAIAGAFPEMLPLIERIAALPPERRRDMLRFVDYLIEDV